MKAHTSKLCRRNLAHFKQFTMNLLAMTTFSCFSCFKDERYQSKSSSDHLFRTPSLTGLSDYISVQKPGLSLSKSKAWRFVRKPIRQKTAGSGDLSSFALLEGPELMIIWVHSQKRQKGRAGCISEKFGWRWLSAPGWPRAATVQASRRYMVARPALLDRRSSTVIWSQGPRSARQEICSTARPTPVSVTDPRRATRHSAITETRPPRRAIMPAAVLPFGNTTKRRTTDV